MTERRASGVDLLVLHDAADELRALLGGNSHSQAHVIDGRDLSRQADHRGLQRWDWGGGGVGILSVPLDAPRSTAEVALACLSRDAAEAILAPAMRGGAPPPWWSLDLVSAGDTVAVDLRGARWHDRTGLWWADRAGPVRLPIRVRTRGGSHVANVLRSLHHRAPVGGALSRWLDDVADRRHLPDEAEWDAALCANYVSFALVHLAQP